MDIELKADRLRKQVNDEVSAISGKLTRAKFYSRISNLSILILALTVVLSASLFYESVQKFIIVLGGVIILINGIDAYFRFAKQSKELQWAFSGLDSLRLEIEFYFEGRSEEEVNEKELVAFHNRFVDIKEKIVKSR